ncbi:MAG TPA: glycoside hydrolase family 38 C-terminal domain-containing protein [Bacteroidota bacterium]|nr:glycoside hydrolase family 38 C-terminal domain-containing protein [Bacteroidota bacterium]
MRPTYHIVSHSHWDREWYRSFEYFRAMLVRMVDDLLDILGNDPEYRCFTLDGQTSVVEDYLAVRPEREPEVARYVKEGRLYVGPWYVLPDEFLVSAEATIRNLMTGRKIASRFGVEMKAGYIPDSFGHIATMPTILRGFDIDNVLLYRGFGGEAGQDTSEYWWHAPDGTRALMVHFYKDGYSGGYFHHSTSEEILHRFASVKKELDLRATTSHRLLMNGGDHHWPDENLPGQIALLAKNFEGNFVHSNLPDYIKAVKTEVSGKAPDLFGELRFGYRYAFAVLGGVYSSRMYLKQENWKCETLMERYVEPLNAIAVASGARSNLPLIRQAWKNLMQNHPHDSICGCSIDMVHREMMTRFAAVSETGRAVIDESLNAIIPYDDRAAADDTYVFFFNPSPFPRSVPAQAEVRFYLQDIVVGLNPDVKVAPKLPPVKGFALVDAQGEEVPYQLLSRSEGYDITYSIHNYPKQTYADMFSVLVDMENVPSLGVKGLKIERRNNFPLYKQRVRVKKNKLENDFLRVDVNGWGEITVTDKTTGKSFSKLGVFEDGGDVGDEYNYSYPKKDTVVLSNTKMAKLSIVEKGPLRGALKIAIVMHIPVSASADRKSRSERTEPVEISTIVSLHYRSRAVEFVTTVNNTVKDHRLRVLFATGINTNTCYADSPFYIAEREQQKYDLKQFTIEHPAQVAPMQRFVSVLDDNVQRMRAAEAKKPASQDVPANALNAGMNDTIPAAKPSRKKMLPGFGAAILGMGLPEYELKYNSKGTVALTLLRCVGLLAAEDLITRPGGKGGWHNETPDAQCPGLHTFRYAFLPHEGGEIEMMERLNEEAELFHLPMLPVRRKNTDAMVMESSFLSLSTKSVVLSAVKEAEAQDGTIVRFWNPTSQKLNVDVETTKPDAMYARLNEDALTPCLLNEVIVKPRGITTLKISTTTQQTV